MSKDNDANPIVGAKDTVQSVDHNNIENQVISDPDTDIQKQSTAEATSSDQQTNKLSNIVTKAGQEKFSAVISSANHRKLVLLVIVIGIIGLVYMLFFRADTDKTNTEAMRLQANKEEISKQSAAVTKAPEEKPVSIPKESPIQELVLAPPAPPPPPQPVAPPPPPVIMNPSARNLDASHDSIVSPFDQSKEDRMKKLEARRKVGIMVTGGGGSGAIDSIAGKKSDGKDKDDGSNQEKKKSASTSGFLGFGEGSLDSNGISESGAPQVVATKVSNLDHTILQGKIIEGVLETAINTDIPGTLRAIVARDVYSESGKNILVHKGSRLIGSYQSEVKPGQTRVNIMWERLIRPDGIDIAIESAGTDQLGRAGTMGKVDNKFWTQMTNAFLVSYVIPISMQKISGNNSQVNTTTSSDGSVTQSGNASNLALQQSSSEFSKLAKSSISDNSVTKPTITVNQGAIIAIIVQKDLRFPSGNINMSNKVLR